MFLNKRLIVLIVGLMLCLTVSAAQKDRVQPNRLLTVEAVYENIRNSSPMYEWEETVITIPHGGMNMVASLILPKTSKKCPIVITLNGFGGVRDSATIPGTDEGIFKRAARIMSERGFATLRLDYRGQGDSDGTYDMTTFSSQITDVQVALEYIRKNLRGVVDQNAIGILGFSQGALAGGIAASRDGRVDSLVLWSIPTYPPHCYEGLITKEGMKKGLALQPGENITLPVVADGVYYFDVTLGHGFFQEMFTTFPLYEISKYKGPLMAVSGLKDPIVWPQPQCSNDFLRVHEGEEKLVVIDADHAFDFWDGPVPEKLDDAIYWSCAWFMTTLR